jgi:hypothetical protein
LERAIASYDQCRRHPGAAPTLVTDAEHNLELARLLWIQARAAAKNADPKTDQQEDGQTPKRSTDKPDPRQTDPRSDSGKSSGQSGDPGNKVQPDPGTKPLESNEKNPGRGTLGTLPDRDELVPLSPEDARAHLAQAVQQIVRERREQQQTAPAPSRGVKDW